MDNCLASRLRLLLELVRDLALRSSVASGAATVSPCSRAMRII